eukprot:IDg13508t1
MIQEKLSNSGKQLFKTDYRQRVEPLQISLAPVKLSDRATEQTGRVGTDKKGMHWQRVLNPTRSAETDKEGRHRRAEERAEARKKASRGPIENLEQSAAAFWARAAFASTFAVQLSSKDTSTICGTMNFLPAYFV